MADGEERAVPEREVAPLAPLIWVTAVMSLLAAIPVMWYLAVVAGVLGALAAAVVGVPVVALARRWELRSAWHAFALGLGAAMLAGSAAGLLAGTVAFPNGQTPQGYLLSMTRQFGLIAAPFGAAAGVAYWAYYVAVEPESKRAAIMSVCAVWATAVLFAINHEIR